MGEAAGVILHELSTGDMVIWNKRYDAVFIKFNQACKVLSTSDMNGGYREDLQGVFNCRLVYGKNGEGPAWTAARKTELRDLPAALALDPGKTTGMGTAGAMEHVAIAAKTFETLTVTAIVTAGIEDGAMRAGDQVSALRAGSRKCRAVLEAIHIILVLDADMPPGTLARALVTCSEAKTAALQELMAGSLYSCSLATGTCADQTIVLANPVSPLYLETAGKHSKLGELIGRAVKQAVKEALVKQGGASSSKRRSIMQRFKRFGLNETTLWRQYAACIERQMEKKEFMELWSRLDGDPELLAWSSLYIHLLDQHLWGLLPVRQLQVAGQRLIDGAAGACCVPAPVIQQPGLPVCLQAWETLLISCCLRQKYIG